jgi:hypothetical protein
MQEIDHIKSGQADINTEIISEANHRFVLHDSRGFEHGTADSVEKVQTFIEKRNKMPDLKNKLHAVW